jgi:hypothetical protein
MARVTRDNDFGVKPIVLPCLFSKLLDHVWGGFPILRSNQYVLLRY